MESKYHNRIDIIEIYIMNYVQIAKSQYDGFNVTVTIQWPQCDIHNAIVKYNNHDTICIIQSI